MRRRCDEAEPTRGADSAAVSTSTEGASTMQHIDPQVQAELEQHRPRYVPPSASISNGAKAIKDLLASDPFNVDLILKLGVAYASDGMWSQCGNVLRRVWERRSSMEVKQRFQYTIILCEALLNQRNHVDALAVLKDCPEPDSAAASRGRDRLACKIYCDNRDSAKALKAFHGAVQGSTGHEAVEILAELQGYLRRGGAYRAAYAAVQRLAKSPEELERLETLGALDEMDQERVEHDASIEEDRQKKTWLKLTTERKIGLAVVGVILLFLMLRMLEQGSLEARHIKRSHTEKEALDRLARDEE